MQLFKDWINYFFMKSGFNKTVSAYISEAIVIVFIFLAGFLTYFIAKKLFLKILKAVVAKSKTKWNNTLFRHKMFERLTFVVFGLVVYIAAPLSSYEEWLRRIAFCLIVFGLLQAFDRFLNVVNDIYRKSEASKTRPLKGYFQVLKIIAYIIGAIIVISVLMERSPLILLGGIGAASAVLLLVFQNTILGFVASIQLTENDMLRPGDWIEMSKHGADGEVMDISLHTVKVQNWDKTVTTIPTYSMVTESFKNWKSMQEAGVRRIKRAINIDMTSIRFCTEEMLERYKKIQYIQEYLTNKISDIEHYNQTRGTDFSNIINSRHLTNIGTFRAYLEAYLKNNPHIHQGMSLLVRQLDPTQYGVPIEIYAFTNTAEWNHYEAIQSDIFDHIFAVIHEFDLKIFQSPTGHVNI